MRNYVVWLLACWCMLSPVRAAVVDWSVSYSTCHPNPDNRRDPTIIFDESIRPPGTCQGYEPGTAFYFAPCNNPLGQWATIPLSPQFQDPNSGFDINNAKVIKVSGRVAITGGTLYFYTRAPGSSWFRSNNSQYPWDTGNVYFTMPVAKVDGIASVQYMLTKVDPGSNPTYNFNLILDEWCE